jgi:3-O-methylgallate 3,4-dioxygenase
MAEIVLGVASSHSPQLSTPAHDWRLHAERDRNNQQLWFRGKTYDYEALAALRAGERLEEQVTEEVWEQRYAAIEAGIRKVAHLLEEAAPDVVVIVGDDQRELFLDDGTPTFAVYWGQEAYLYGVPASEVMPAMRPSHWANHGERDETFPTVPELGLHLIQSLMDESFDVVHLRRQPAGRSIGHAFVFVEHRLLTARRPPVVPVMINTYFPPNQPTAERCYRFGQALGRAIRSWNGANARRRVALVASGGLSHFVIDEALDHRIVEGIRAGDAAALTTIDQNLLTSGTSEVRCWIAVAGACQGLKGEVLDYIPAYRTPAGTGCGMAFARWS